MTISTTTNKVVAQGNGATTTFSYNFLIPQAADAAVVVVDASGNVTTLTPSQYTLSGVGNRSGGTLTYPLSGSPLPTGSAIVLTRTLPLQQLTLLANQAGYYPDVVEAALDNIEMQMQQVAGSVGNALRYPDVDPPTLQAILPPAAARAGFLLGFAPDGSAVPVAPVSGSAADLALQLLAENGSSKIGWFQIGTNPTLQTVMDKLRSVAVTPSDFAGVVGDDSHDDTVGIQNAIAAAAGRTLRLGAGTTYKIASDELVLLTSTHVDGNGAQLHFTHTNPGKRCLAVVTGCVVENLFVNNTSGVLGSNGTYQTPVVIGDAASTTVNSNIKLRNLTISSLSPGGNGIAIIGATNVDVEGITYPSSSTIAIALLCHWSSAAGGASATSHVHNVRIDNIKCGVMSYGTSGTLGIAAVFLSAVYGVKVSNVYADQFTHGAAVTVYAGDYGYQYGTTVEQAMGMVGIDITGITGQYLFVGHVYGSNPSGAVQQVWPGGITFEKVGAYGTGVADANSQGIRLENCEGVQVKCGAVNAFQVGVYLGGTVTDVTIEDFRILNSRTYGIFADTTSGTPNFSEVVIRDARIVGSNQSSASNIADISFGACAGLLIEECKFNSSNATWNVVVANTVTVMRALNNRTLGVGAGPCYAIGANTDTAICSLFEGNTCDAAAIPAGGLRNGQIFIPHAVLMRNASGEQPKVFTGSFSPDRGTWARGSICWNDQASVGQPKGWACTVTGTPGTWVSMGNL